MEKHDLMKKHIKTWLGSNKSIRQYCLENKLPYEGFRHWRDKLAPETKQKRSGRNSRILPVELGEDSPFRRTSEISILIETDTHLTITVRNLK
jgi:hypothetical protein